MEVELDIEIAGAAAPGASIAVYFVGTAGSNAWVETLSRAFGDTGRSPPRRRASRCLSPGVAVTAPGGASAVEPADQFTYN